MAPTVRGLGAFLVVLAALAVCGGADAIVGGAPDGNAHPYAGGFLQQQTHDGTTAFERCSGFLVGATHFVTAAHCVEPGGRPIQLTFGPTLSPADPNLVPATFTASSGDVAVLTLDPRFARPGPYAALPARGESDTTSAVDTVGYGVEGLDPKKAPTAFGLKSVATTSLKSAGSLSDQTLKLLASPGACLGDSGGPNLTSGTNTVLGMTESGSKNCNGVYFAQRLDTPAMLQFLAPFANS